jgi:hypothetical protein
LHRATTTAVQVATSVPEIMDTPHILNLTYVFTNLISLILKLIEIDSSITLKFPQQKTILSYKTPYIVTLLYTLQKKNNKWGGGE